MDRRQLPLLLIFILSILPPVLLGVNTSQPPTEEPAESEEEPSLVGIFSGLLETLTETASSTSCPGQCIHTIRAFMCEHVLESGNCPGTLKCCVEEPPMPKNVTMHPPVRHGPWGGPPPPGYRPHYGQPPPGYRPNAQYGPPPQGFRPPVIQEIQGVPPQPHPEGQEETQSTHALIHTTTVGSVQVEPQRIPTTDPPSPQSQRPHQEKQTTTTTPIPSPVVPHTVAPTNVHWNNVTCPGVCVSPRMTSSCEAVYRVPSACKNELQCCVILDNYHGDRGNLFIREDEESPETAEDDEEEEKLPSPERRPPPPRPQAPPSPPNRLPLESRRPPQSQQQPIRGGEQDGPPPRSDLPGNPDTCPGTCITPFFTFFCDQVLDFECPNEGKCCLNQEKKEPKPRPHPPPPQSQLCPRVCLPNHMTGACPRALPFDCAQGFFCCIGPPLTQQPPPQGHESQGPRPIQTPPPQRIRTTTTTTTTTTTEPPMETHKLACPGSCINNILTFTCFRNAEITELFTCAKAGTKCCAPKTAIREHLDSINGTEDKTGEENVGDSGGSEEMSPPLPRNPIPKYGLPQGPLPPKVNQIPPNHVMMPPVHHPSQGILDMVPPQPLPLPPPTRGPPVVLPQAKIQNSRSNYICGLKGSPLSPSNVNPNALMGGIAHVRNKRVVGGSDSYPGEWCWQVALINSLNQYLCGAALIGTQWVLTAAHCLTNIVRTGSTIYVRVGDHDLTSKYGSPSAQTLRVATTYIHHNHNSQTLDNDIALLKLQGQVDLRDGVCLVCLPARGEGVRAGRRCTVTGYGYMGEAGPIPLRIREATLPIISDHDCIRQVNAVTEKTFLLPASSFCAGGESNNDACQGDGGGPLVCQDEGYYELTGLVSWGFGCGREDVPGVYVKVSSFIGWINQIISVNN